MAKSHSLSQSSAAAEKLPVCRSLIDRTRNNRVMWRPVALLTVNVKVSITAQIHYQTRVTFFPLYLIGFR